MKYIKLHNYAMQSPVPYSIFFFFFYVIKAQIKIIPLELCLSNDPFGIPDKGKEMRIYSAGSKWTENNISNINSSRYLQAT